MRQMLSALAVMTAAALAGCGAAPSESAGAAAGAESAEPMEAASGANACPLMARIIAARSDTPAFSSLDPTRDVIPGATRCAVLDSIELADTWSLAGGPKAVTLRTYQCTLYEGADAAEAQRVWDEATSTFARSCFTGDWQFGASAGRAMGGSRTPIRTTSYWRDGLALSQDADGVNYQALAFGWWNTAGGADQRVFFQATAAPN
ncbi:MAG: hypothetical protein GC206_09165 [Alphaproteobacteria bacterium]|nr:hypothetical protein [Alphaproteobacteria bacterium]